MKPLNNNLENLFIEVQLKPQTKPYTYDGGVAIDDSEVSLLESADKLIVYYWFDDGDACVASFDSSGRQTRRVVIASKHIRRVKKESK